MNQIKSLFAAVAILSAPVLAGTWSTYTMTTYLVHDSNLGTICHIYTTASSPNNVFVFVVDDFGSKAKCDAIRDHFNSGASTIDVYSASTETINVTYTTGGNYTRRVALGIAY